MPLAAPLMPLAMDCDCRKGIDELGGLADLRELWGCEIDESVEVGL